jgi:CMP-N-acetylneuraminic acid synthetase
LDKFVVSTEDKEIELIARKYGADILPRPQELAQDTTDTLSVLKHAVQSIPCDTVVLLQTTSPVRSEGLVDECIKEFTDEKADSLATGFYCKYIEYEKNNARRQDISGFFHDDGKVYVIRADLIKNGDRYGKKNIYKTISREENVDIDECFDFWLAEKILLERHP